MIDPLRAPTIADIMKTIYDAVVWPPSKLKWHSQCGHSHECENETLPAWPPGLFGDDAS